MGRKKEYVKAEAPKGEKKEAKAPVAEKEAPKGSAKAKAKWLDSALQRHKTLPVKVGEAIAVAKTKGEGKRILRDHLRSAAVVVGS